MEFKSEILSHLLRIITPRSITQLSTASSGKKKVPLSLIIESYCEDDEDEIVATEEDSNVLLLKTDDEEKEETPREVTVCGPRVDEAFKKFSKLCAEMDKNVLGPKRLARRKLDNNSETTMNLLEQKKKFEKSNHLLKSREILNLYQTTSKSSVSGTPRKEKESGDKNDLQDRERGILVNKKQA